jgi:hypothetical protein
MSQPLSRCVDRLLMENNYTMVLDLHTGEFSLYFLAKHGSDNYKRSQAMLNKVQKQYCKACRVAVLREVNDSDEGHLFAYAKETYHVEYSFLFEIYGGFMNDKYIPSPLVKCFKVFNPNTARFKNYMVNKWVRAMDLTMREILKDKGR